MKYDARDNSRLRKVKTKLGPKSRHDETGLGLGFDLDPTQGKRREGQNTIGKILETRGTKKTKHNMEETKTRETR